VSASYAAPVAVPAAINALPGVISAIRGRKDVVPYPAPAPAQQRSIEGFTAEDEKILRAVAPAVAEAMRAGVDNRYRVAI
jgi:hypothetical protein